jgi:hypothetical protein
MLHLFESKEQVQEVEEVEQQSQPQVLEEVVEDRVDSRMEVFLYNLVKLLQLL